MDGLRSAHTRERSEETVEVVASLDDSFLHLDNSELDHVDTVDGPGLTEPCFLLHDVSLDTSCALHLWTQRNP